MAELYPGFRLQPTPLTSPAVPTARVVPVAVMAPVIGVMALGWCAAIMARSGARGAMGLSAATVASAVARMRPEPCAAIGIRSGCWCADWSVCGRKHFALADDVSFWDISRLQQLAAAVGV